MIRRGARRRFLAIAGGLAAIVVSRRVVGAAASEPAGPMREAIRRVVGEARVVPGGITLELPPLVENGNVVPMTVAVESPMTDADHVKAIHVFNEKNPQPDVATFRLGPRSGRASVSTRIRLADSQMVMAVCEMSDGSFRSQAVHVVVTLAACLDEVN